MSQQHASFATGSVTATGVICSLGVQDIDWSVGVGAAVGGTFVGTCLCEVTYDGTTWVQFGNSATAGATWQITQPVLDVRLRCSAFTSGTLTGGIGVVKS